MVKAGLQAIYLSGWQVAADANLSGHTYPDQSLYPANSGPALAKRINSALLRADQIAHAEGDDSTYWLAPIVADAEAGFGGPLNAFEIMTCVHRGRRGGGALRGSALLGEEVRSPRRQGARAHVTVRPHARRRTAGGGRGRRADRWSSRARTPSPPRCSRATSTRPTASSARASARPRASTASATASKPPIARGLAYAPYADLVWFETSTPDLQEAEQFAAAIHERFPGKWLAYNCSPSFNWRKHLNDAQIAGFQRDLAGSATGSSSSRWPASTHSTSRCSSSRAATATRR